MELIIYQIKSTKKATGLDISEFSIKRAKHLYSQFADYSIGDATRTHFNDNMFNSNSFDGNC